MKARNSLPRRRFWREPLTFPVAASSALGVALYGKHPIDESGVWTQHGLTLHPSLAEGGSDQGTVGVYLSPRPPARRRRPKTRDGRVEGGSTARGACHWVA